MGSRFLSSGSDLSSLADGTFALNVASAGVQNLTANLPVKTDSTKLLTSGLIQLTDCNFAPLVNPAGSALDMGGNDITDIRSSAYTAGIHIGASTTTGDTDGIAIGNSAATPGLQGIAIGHASSVLQTDGIAIGDTANNNIANSCLIGDPAIVNIRANHSLNGCDLGTSAEPFKACYLRDGQPAAGTKFVMYGPVTLTNTITETSLISGTQVGNLVYGVSVASQNAGLVMRIILTYSLTVGAADQCTIRLKKDGIAMNGTAVLGGAALAAVAGQTIFEITIGATVYRSYVESKLNGAYPAITVDSGSYDRTTSHTFTITGQWSAASAGDSLLVTSVRAETLYLL